MTKKIVSIVALLLCCMLIFGACTPSDKPNTDDPVIPDAPSKEVYAKTNIPFVKDGASNYTVLVTEDADSNVRFVANEIQLFVEMATGAVLPIVTEDANATYSDSDYIIALGNTSLFQQTGLQLTTDMGQTGYYAKRYGNAVVLNATNSNGVASAVYEFLRQAIDLEVYSVDEFDYTESTTVMLPDIDVKGIPDIDVRRLLIKSVYNDSQYNLRVGFYSDNTPFGIWAAFAHTTITDFLPLDTYYNDHPDWYAADKSQVCYANDEMRAEMVNVIKQRLTKNDEALYIQIGHEDNLEMCECDKCKAEREKYGGYSGQELNFTNKIAREVNEWLEEAYPGRTVKFVFFAYGSNQTPPIKTKIEVVDGVEKEVAVLDENGRCIPYYDDFTIEDDVMVMYAPVDGDFSKGFSEKENGSAYEQVRGWRDLFLREGREDGIIIWSYTLYCYGYFVPFYQYGSSKTQYQFYKDLGVSYVMDQGQYDSNTPCFEALRIYTMSKLMQDTSLDYNELAYDFIDHYYGPAGDTFKQYFDFFRSYYKQLDVAYGLNGTIKFDVEDPKYWPTGVIDKMFEYLNQCLQDIEPLKQTDYDRWSVLNDRIRRERLTPIYLMFQLHINEVPLDVREEYYNDMVTYTRKYEIMESHESSMNIDQLIEDWSAKLFGGNA